MWQLRGTASRLSQRETTPALMPVIISSEKTSQGSAITRSDAFCHIKPFGGDVMLHHPTPELLSAMLH